jgi:hypothetical protein
MLQIGSLALEPAKPEKLDEQLVASTGCSAREVRELLTNAAVADWPRADLVAAALLPFLKDAPPRHVLAQEIALEGVIPMRKQVQELYDDELGIEPR